MDILCCCGAINHRPPNCLFGALANTKGATEAPCRYIDVIMSAMVSQITSLNIVCSNVYSGVENIKAQVTSEFPAQAPVTRQMFPFDDVIMLLLAGDRGFPHWCPLMRKAVSFNPLRAKFVAENINIYLHFMSFLHTNKTQVVEIPPRVKPGPAYFTQSISWLLISWRRKEPGHQQTWYWPS